MSDFEEDNNPFNSDSFETSGLFNSTASFGHVFHTENEVMRGGFGSILDIDNHRKETETLLGDPHNSILNSDLFGDVRETSLFGPERNGGVLPHNWADNDNSNHDQNSDNDSHPENTENSEIEDNADMVSTIAIKDVPSVRSGSITTVNGTVKTQSISTLESPETVMASFDSKIVPIIHKRKTIDTSYMTGTQKILMSSSYIPILIPTTTKTKGSNGKSYISYTIQLQNLKTERRYSDFESLRKYLLHLFPTIVIPPIPAKHRITDYILAPGSAKEDVGIIEYRRRMFTSFLNRCKDIPEIRNSSVFYRFLDPGVSWIEILKTPPLCNLPENILLGPPLDPTGFSEAHKRLPIPQISTNIETRYDNQLKPTELMIKNYKKLLTSRLEQTTRRVNKRYNEMVSDLAALGAHYNAFSLEEDTLQVGPGAIERVGQAVDTNFINTEALISSLTIVFNEPILEMAKYATAIQGVLKYRKMKELQYEISALRLKRAKDKLIGLEMALIQAERLEEAITRQLEHSTSVIAREFEEQRRSLRDNPDHGSIENDDGNTQDDKWYSYITGKKPDISTKNRDRRAEIFKLKKDIKMVWLYFSIEI